MQALNWLITFENMYNNFQLILKSMTSALQKKNYDLKDVEIEELKTKVSEYNKLIEALKRSEKELTKELEVAEKKIAEKDATIDSNSNCKYKPTLPLTLDHNPLHLFILNCSTIFTVIE